MKHGDKAKSKKASKASGKKSSKAGASRKASAKSSKASHVVKAKKQSASRKTEKQSSKSGASGGNGKPRGRISPDFITFTNPLVANAFKRAVKKYPNAFRRLTD